MRRTSLLAAAALAVVALSTACGGDPSTSPTTAGEGTLGTAVPSSTPSASPSATGGGGGGGGGGVANEDCYTYDPQMLMKNYAAGVHVIRADHGDEILRVYGGPADPVGAAALAVATRFETVCYIGRGNSFDSQTYVFEYWQDPSGMVHPDEPAGLFSECVHYAPSDLAVSSNPDGPGWVIRVDGDVLQLFATEADANAAIEVMTLYGEICYILNRTPAPENAPASITFTINTGD